MAHCDVEDVYCMSRFLSLPTADEQETFGWNPLARPIPLQPLHTCSGQKIDVAVVVTKKYLST